MLEYRSERIPPISQVDRIEAKRPLEMARDTLYCTEFRLEMDRTRQVTRYPTFRLQEYYRLYEPDQGCAQRDRGLKDHNGQ